MKSKTKTFLMDNHRHYHADRDYDSQPQTGLIWSLVDIYAKIGLQAYIQILGVSCCYSYHYFFGNVQ